MFLYKNHLWILACTTGFYGKKCSVPCPPSCNVTCEHTDGSCNNCKEGSESHCSKGRYTWLSFEIYPFVTVYILNWYADAYSVI